MKTQLNQAKVKFDQLDPKYRGIIFILISVTCFAIMNLVVKKLHGIPTSELVLFRSVVSVILSLIVIKSKGLNPLGNNKKWLLVRGIFGVGALTLFFWTLQELPLGSAITLQYLSPIFTAIFAVFILKENMAMRRWFYFFLSFLGVVLIKGFDPRIDTIHLLAGVGSAMFSGVAYNAIRKLKDSDHPVVVVLYFPLVATPIMLIASLFFWVTPTGMQWPLLISMGVLTQIAQVYMTKAYQTALVSQVAGFNYIGILYAIGFDFVIFGITYPPMVIAGIVLVVIGVLLNLFYKG